MGGVPLRPRRRAQESHRGTTERRGATDGTGRRAGGWGMKPFVIAEFASCHLGSLDKALEGIAVAHSAGASAYKVQFWSEPLRMRARRRVLAPAYEQGSIQAEWLPALKKECHDRGLAFSASVFLPEDVATLAPHVDYWKVSSFEARDRNLTKLIPRD